MLTKKTCNQNVACSPCYASDTGCGDEQWYASAAHSEAYPRILGGATFPSNSTGEYTSCVSYTDAYNRALYDAMYLSYVRGGFGRPAVWGSWTQTWDNTEVSATANCPCGWTGDSVTVTKEAGTYLNYWTPAEANTDAYNEALAEAEASLACTEPTDE